MAWVEGNNYVWEGHRNTSSVVVNLGVWNEPAPLTK